MGSLQGIRYETCRIHHEAVSGVCGLSLLHSLGVDQTIRKEIVNIDVELNHLHCRLLEENQSL